MTIDYKNQGKNTIREFVNNNLEEWLKQFDDYITFGTPTIHKEPTRFQFEVAMPIQLSTPKEIEKNASDAELKWNKYRESPEYISLIRSIVKSKKNTGS